MSYISVNKYGTEDLWKRPISVIGSACARVCYNYYYYFLKLNFFSREATAEEEKSEVQYQRLRPGLDAKKGIPDDGHRGWKKYGNKTIQNANFCRYFLPSFLPYLLTHQFCNHVV
jgi:hypothetical protein